MIEPRNTEVALPVSVSVTSSGVVSVVELMFTWTVSEAFGSVFRPVSTTWTLTVAEDWYLGWSMWIVPRCVAMPPVITMA